MGYDYILTEIGQSRVAACIEYSKAAPYLLEFANPSDLTFPPAFIPIWMTHERDIVYGVLKHWFGIRDVSFVKFYLEYACMEEIGRSELQFLAFVVFEMLLNAPLEDFDRINDFSIEVGLGGVNSYFPEDIQELTDLRSHPDFLDLLPRALMLEGDVYTGGFPINGVSSLLFCGFELVGEDPMLKRPGWIQGSESLQTLFKLFLERGEHEKAWMTLNSPGWGYDYIVDALRGLDDKKSDKLFSALSELWISTHGSVECY